MHADVHAHLDDKWIHDDLDAVLARAREAGVSAIVQNGINHQTNIASLVLAKGSPLIKAMMGIYPGEIQCDIKGEIDFIRKHADEIVGIGEVGLDGTLPEMPVQREVFGKMIDLAHDLGKPISVHSRSAEKEVLDMLEERHARKVHLHCFCGNMGLVERGVKNGYLFSVPPSIGRSSHFQQLVKIVPTSQLLTETDSPYLGPVRGERNEPANVVLAVRHIASIKGMTEEDMGKILFMNYKRLFG